MLVQENRDLILRLKFIIIQINWISCSLMRTWSCSGWGVCPVSIDCRLNGACFGILDKKISTVLLKIVRRERLNVVYFFDLKGVFFTALNCFAKEISGQFHWSFGKLWFNDSNILRTILWLTFCVLMNSGMNLSYQFCFLRGVLAR